MLPLANCLFTSCRALCEPLQALRRARLPLAATLAPRLPALMCLLLPPSLKWPPLLLPPFAVVAAAVLYVERKSRGMAPYWPTALSSLTGYSLQARPSLCALLVSSA